MLHDLSLWMVVAPKLQALVYDIIPPTTAISDCAKVPEKLSLRTDFVVDVDAEIAVCL